MPVKGGHASPETCKKLSVAHKGKRHTTETKTKISTSQQGEKNHNWGKPLAPETRTKLSIANSGRRLPEERRVEMAVLQMGEKNSMFGKTGDQSVWYGKHHTIETKLKMSAAQRGENNPMYGKHHSQEACKKMSAERGGENNPRWLGGISFEPYCPKFNDDLKRRIRAFFENQCVMCGNPNPNGNALSCHHCTYDKMVCCNDNPVQFVALCHRHHTATNNGNRARWEAMLHRCIDEIWGGRSYYTKEEYAEICQQPPEEDARP